MRNGINIFGTYFVLGTDSSVNDKIFEHSASDEVEYALNRCFSDEEFIKAVNKLNCRKASGPDGVVAEILKAGVYRVIHFS